GPDGHEQYILSLPGHGGRRATEDAACAIKDECLCHPWRRGQESLRAVRAGGVHRRQMPALRALALSEPETGRLYRRTATGCGADRVGSQCGGPSTGCHRKVSGPALSAARCGAPARRLPSPLCLPCAQGIPSLHWFWL